MSARKFPYIEYDVFTSTPLQGNQLGVVPDARGLSDAEMQAFARETNLSETTFVLPGDAARERERGVRVRIFTTQEELPFAGHPTLGTAFYLHERDGKDTVELDLNVGKIPVTFTRGADGLLRGEMRQRDPEFGQTHPHEAVARAMNIATDELDASLPIQTVSTGMAFAIVPVRSLKTMQSLKIEWPRCAQYLAGTDAKFFYFVSRETTAPERNLHARMIFYNGEDPATGSAGGCCAAWAVANGVVPPDQPAIIEQGVEMHRESLIHFRASKSGETVNNVRVGGSVVKIITGEFTI